MSIKKYACLSKKSPQDFLLETFVVSEVLYINRKLKTSAWNTIFRKPSLRRKMHCDSYRALHNIHS